MPLTPAQLQAHVDAAGAALQAIQDELGRDRPGGKVRFPRGYIKTVAAREGSFWWVQNTTLRRNLCYHLIFSDVLRWLLNRTTLSLVARGMVVKHTIALMGGIAESLTVAAMGRLGHGKRNFSRRVEQLVSDGIVSEAQQKDLLWLWDARSSVHVYEVTDLELDAYQVTSSNRAIRIVQALGTTLANRFQADVPY